MDSAGNAYVTGYTASTDFPTTPGAFQTTYGGNQDAFVTKLNPTGTALVYSTYLGGTSGDYGLGIAVDTAGNAYVTGGTESTDFPTTAGAYQTTYGGTYDAFVAKFAFEVQSTTTTVVSSVNPSSFGQAVTLTATVTANAPGSGSPTGTVTFYVGPVNPADQIGTGTLSSSSGVMTATLSTSSLPVGTDTITATYSGDGNFLTSTGTLTITINQSIIVLDPSAGGALSLTGNASINIPGVVYVDSGSSTALSASGNAQVTASVIDVHGSVQKKGNASLSPTPITGAQTLADPLSGLALPSTSGMKNYGTENLSGNSSGTIQPGIYKQITVSGNAKLKMSSWRLHHRGGRLLRVRKRRRQRVRGDDLQRGKQLSQHGWQLRQYQPERERVVQLEPAVVRDLRGNRDLPAKGQYPRPLGQRQSLGCDRRDLRTGGATRRERQRPAQRGSRCRYADGRWQRGRR